MYTGEISAVVVQKRVRCRGGSQHHYHWPTLDWGRDFSKTFPPPLTEAAIFESPKFSKVLRTAFIISCQCCSLLYANSYHFLLKFILPLSLTVRKKNTLLSTKRKQEASLSQSFLTRTAVLWTLPGHMHSFFNIRWDSFWKHCKFSHLTLSSLPQITTLNWKLSPARMPST